MSSSGEGHSGISALNRLSTLESSNNDNNKSKDIYTPVPDSLTGQSFLITGGTTGIGLETAKNRPKGKR